LLPDHHHKGRLGGPREVSREIACAHDESVFAGPHGDTPYLSEPVDTRMQVRPTTPYHELASHQLQPFRLRKRKES
jgi:hypothetical protein